MTRLLLGRSRDRAAGRQHRQRQPVIEPAKCQRLGPGRDEEISAARGNRIAIRHSLGRVVCVIEIVSPGNKGARSALHAFVEKTVDFIQRGVHVLVVDLFPPSVRDPQGIHKAIWDEFQEEDFELPSDKPLVLAAYDAGPRVAYVDSIAVGDALPDMPLFLEPEVYVPAPLEASYQTAWSDFPAALKGLLEGPSVPPPA